jgi:hypothetical protein
MDSSQNIVPGEVYVLVRTRHGIADVLGVYTSMDKARAAKDAYEEMYKGQRDVALNISGASIDKLPR